MHISRLAIVLSALSLGAAAVVPLAAQQKMAVNLATVAPAGSIWHDALRRMDAGWREATGGRITVTLFPGGVQGDEETMLRRMRAGQLQAAALTTIGLTRIDSAFNVFSIPFFFESQEELNHVVERLTPTLRETLERNGFVLINWGHAGWVQVFSTRPVATLDDLKGVRLYTSAGDDAMVQWYVRNGFRPVALSINDIFTGLQTGQIEAVPFTPMGALSFQWYRLTPHMLEVGLAPVIGATVLSRAAWNRIAEADRPRLLEVATRVGERLETEVPRQDADAIAEMKKRGLNVRSIEETGAAAAWRAAGEAFAQTMRGTMVPEALFDLALRERNAYRQRSGGGAR